MGETTSIGRRDALVRGGALGLGGLGMLSGMRPGRALAQQNPSLPNVNIVNPAGGLTLVCEQMLTDGPYFGDFGIRGTFLNVSDGGKILAALVSGNGDICGGAGFANVFPAVERGAKLKVLGGMTMSPLTALYTKRPEIKEAKDLIGRTVGTGAPGQLLHELAVGLFQKKGIDWRQVKFVNIGSAVDVFKAVVAGTVDAGVAEVDYYDRQKEYGVHVLSDGKFWDELPNFVNQAFYTTDDIIAKKRPLLVAALAAHAKLFRYVASPASKADFFKERVKALNSNSTEDAESQWAFFQVPGRLGVNLKISPDSIEYVQKLNVELGVQKAVLPFDQVADMTLADDALKMLTAKSKG